MKVFSPTERCEKCGSMVKIERFTRVVGNVLRGALILKCTGCGYRFKRAPLPTETKE